MAIIFFGAVVNLLYYWGILQILIRAFGRAMQVLMQVGPIEAFCAVANVFLGPVKLCFNPHSIENFVETIDYSGTKLAFHLIYRMRRYLLYVHSLMT